MQLSKSPLKRIIIELHATPVIGQYGVQVHKEGLDDMGWDFVHSMLGQAMHTVAREWVRRSMEVWQLPQIIQGGKA